MRIVFPALSLIALAAMPLPAAGLADTHQELTVPAGKLPAKAFRPLAKQPCAAARANPSGSRPATTQPARSTEACAKAEAAARS